MFLDCVEKIMNVSCFVQVKNYIFTNLSQCAQKIHKALSNARENFTIQKVKSLFESKIEQIKSSEFYSELKDLSTGEKVCIVVLPAAMGAIIWLITVGFLGMALLACIIATFMFLSAIPHEHFSIRSVGVLG